MGRRSPINSCNAVHPAIIDRTVVSLTAYSTSTIHPSFCAWSLVLFGVNFHGSVHRQADPLHSLTHNAMICSMRDARSSTTASCSSLLTQTRDDQSSCQKTPSQSSSIDSQPPSPLLPFATSAPPSSSDSSSLLSSCTPTSRSFTSPSVGVTLPAKARLTAAFVEVS